MNRTFICGDEAETLSIAARLAKCLKPGMFIALYGDLGAGKTTFVRGVGLALRCNDVTSPTFTIVQEYDTDPVIYHFDAYRLSSTDELYAMGYEDYLDGSGVIFMEWPEIVTDALPDKRLEIRLTAGENGREIVMIPVGNEYEKMMRVL